MKTSKMLALAVVAMSRNKTRAALTTLGIVIGIAAVIAMTEIGQGSASAIQRTIESMGANNLLVFPGTAASGGVSFGAGSILTLTPDDAAAIVRECPAASAAAPIVRARTQVVRGNRNWVPQYIYGTTPDYLTVRDWLPLAAGEPFTDRDVHSAARVVLIGATLARELFPGESPVGCEIRVKNTICRVVGVLQQKGANMMGMDQDDIVLAPWTTIKYRIANTALASANQSASAGGSGPANAEPYPGSVQLYPQASPTQQADTPLPVRFANVDQITLASRDQASTAQAQQQVTGLLRLRHRLRADESDDFNVRDMTEMTRAVAATAGMMTSLLLSVALISLVVGGVGIMNIMLVSVTERTREIGLRMAVGARQREVLQQFLAEAVMLCLAGGILGILLGRGTSYLISRLLGWSTELSPAAVAAAVGVSVTVGVLFGFYPAFKASRLNPIEALRYE